MTIEEIAGFVVILARAIPPIIISALLMAGRGSSDKKAQQERKVQALNVFITL